MCLDVKLRIFSNKVLKQLPFDIKTAGLLLL